jgi:hypothetical protein
MAFNASSYVYTFEDVSFKVAGKSYAVSGVSATLQECGMPSIILTVNPKPDPGTNDVETPTLTDFMGWHGALQALAATKKTVASLTVKGVSETDTQELTVTKWLFTQAGILEVGAAGSFSTQVVLQHPLFAATNGELAFCNKYNDGEYGAKLEGDISDMSSLVVSSIKNYLDFRNPDAGEKDEGATAELAEKVADTILKIDETVHARALEAYEALKANITWDAFYAGERIAFQVHDPEIVDNYYAIGGICPDGYLESRMSPYTVFMTMLAQMMLVTYGTVSDDPVKVRPAEPWSAAEAFIYEEEISSIILPPESRVRISGTLGRSVLSVVDVEQNNNCTVSDTKMPHSLIVTSGAYVDMSGLINGTIKEIYPPEFIARGFGGDPNGLVHSVRENVNTEAIVMAGGSDPNAAAAAIQLDGYKLKIMNDYCHDDFWRTYGSDVTLGLVTRLMVKTRKGVLLRPGMVLTVLGDGDKPVYTCYITTVQHNISVQEGRAFTSLQGSYARGPEGIKGVYDPAKPVTSKIYAAAAPPQQAAGQSNLPVFNIA